MKRRYIYQCLLILITIFNGLACSNEEEAFVLRNTDVLNFSHEASSQTFTVRSNGTWSVSSPDEWITLNPAAGNGDGVAYENITVTVTHNGKEARSGKIAIHAAGRDIYISVHQNEGFLLFGQPSLSGSLAIGEPATGINLRIPYSRAAGNEQFHLSVRVSGEAADGIEPVNNYPVSLTDKEGMIYVPLTGEPTKDGQLRFSVSATYPNTYIEPLNVFVGANKVYHNAD
ncbi:MAG: BACON domain-containing protein, partial [Prevotellaceae bacterium]|nr:BACON domain-containing protein [Prevotellaceae bacterium]